MSAPSPSVSSERPAEAAAGGEAAASPRAVTLRRSVLFAPASNARAVAKLADLTADVVVLDLEDAVGPDDKDTARAAAADCLRSRALSAPGPTGRMKALVVRVNALETPEGAADLNAIAPLGPDAVLLPKVESAEDVARVSAAFDALDVPRGMALWAMIETPKAALNLAEIASLGARRRLAALVVGTNDLAASLRMPAAQRRARLGPVLLNTVLAARAHGLAAIDGVYNDHRDLSGFAAEADEAASYGFDGKSLIHPSQIAPCHAAFAPTPEALAWAHKVCAAFQSPENLKSGVISVDGHMVERLHLAEAERLIALAEAAGDGAPA